MQIEMVFNCDLSYEHDLDKFLKCVKRLDLTSEFYDFSSKKFLPISDIDNFVYLSKGRWFSFGVSDGEITLSYLSDLKFYRLDIVGICKSVSDVNLLIGSILECESFVQARIYDKFYDESQNARDVKYFEMRGLDYSKLKKQKNNLPPPFDAIVVDTSANPGRWTLKAGYIESIGATMWLGDHFWSYVGQEKKQKLFNESWIRTEVLENGVVKLIAADECFMDESTADKQNRLREILYGSEQ